MAGEVQNQAIGGLQARGQPSQLRPQHRERGLPVAQTGYGIAIGVVQNSGQRFDIRHRIAQWRHAALVFVDADEQGNPPPFPVGHAPCTYRDRHGFMSARGGAMDANFAPWLDWVGGTSNLGSVLPCCHTPGAGTHGAAATRC